MRLPPPPASSSTQVQKQETEHSEELKNLKVTMTLLVRNEQDILEENIWFHQSQGVNSFIIMDNLSSDRTKDIILNIAKEIDVEYIFQPEDNYNQSIWVTAMAQRAFSIHRADWIINNDADEFWLPDSGTLQELLAATSPEIGTLRVRRYNAILSYEKSDPLLATSHPRYSDLFERDSINNLGQPLPRKCIHRASETSEISPGNHNVKGLTGDTVDIDDGIKILHYPYRSIEHYKRKIRTGGAAYGRNSSVPISVGATWRKHYDVVETDSIDRFWRSLSRPKQSVFIDQIEGKVFQNRYLIDFFENRSKQNKDKRIQNALSLLHSNTKTIVDEFTKYQTNFISRIAEKDRKYRPQYYNLRFSLNGPLRQLDSVVSLCRAGSKQDLYKIFSNLRDMFSLFPRNTGFKEFLAELLSTYFAEDVSRLRIHCHKKRVIMHVSCAPRYHLADLSIQSFVGLSDDYHHLVIVGTPGSTLERETPLRAQYDGRTLTVPVPDDYENLHRKIFYALTILHLVADVTLIVKVDDNIRLKDASLFEGVMTSIASGKIDYAGRVIGSDSHQKQWHGWHISKCNDLEVESRGYQYPLPRKYAAGGYGYVLGGRGIEACAYMYLAMKEFFSMQSVGLEDAYVGHAMYAQGIEVHNVASPEHLLAFPGLASTEVDEFCAEDE